MKKRGRPFKSEVRQNIVEILFHMREGYGYEIYKTYLKLFPKVTRRLIYYHLNKGIELQEFEIKTREKEKGKYSWGDSVEKIYYKLGTEAKPSKNKHVENFFQKKNAVSDK